MTIDITNIFRVYPVTDVCPTGLSGGAIAGIVIGSLAGAALIGAGIYFLFCRNTDDEEPSSYAPGHVINS